MSAVCKIESASVARLHSTPLDMICAAFIAIAVSAFARHR